MCIRDRDDTARVQAGVLHVLRHNMNNGHTCLPLDKLCPAAAHLLSVEREVVQDAVIRLCESFQTVCEDFGGREFLFLQNLHVSETYIAARMQAMLGMNAHPIAGAEEKIAAIEKSRGMHYAAKQKEAIRAALEQGILLLTGGPGTGKTTTLNAIIQRCV